MLKEAQLISLLDKVLSQSGVLRKGDTEIKYRCPFNNCRQDKLKLECCVDTTSKDFGSWQCWICHSRGRSIYSLFKKLKVKDQYFDELNKIVGGYTKKYISDNDGEEKQQLYLPDEFIPLSGKTQVKSFEYADALLYLKSRNVLMDDIIRYNIGFCEEGKYKQRVIIPSYDKDGNVNFFSARAYHKDNPWKYMLPSASKNIVGNELFINFSEPITICEGSFDSLSIRNNSIPLFGTTMSFALKLAIVINRVKRINIVLDNDALKQAIDIFDRIEDLQVNDIDIHLIKLGDKDPSVIGFEAITELIENSKPFDFSDIVKAKMETI